MTASSGATESLAFCEISDDETPFFYKKIKECSLNGPSTNFFHLWTTMVAKRILASNSVFRFNIIHSIWKWTVLSSILLYFLAWCWIFPEREPAKRFFYSGIICTTLAGNLKGIFSVHQNLKCTTHRKMETKNVHSLDCHRQRKKTL